MNEQSKSLVQLHFAVLLFGGTALFSHLLPWSALDITMFRSGLAACALAVMIKFQRDNLLLNNATDYKVALILGVLIGLHWVTYFYAMQLAGVAVGMLAFFCYPVVTVFLEPLFNKTRAHRRDILCAIAVFIGVLLLVPELSMQNDTTLGVVIGVVSGFLFALRNVLHKQYFSHYKGTQAMFYQTLVVSLMLVSFVDFNPLEMTGVWHDGAVGELGLLVVLSVIFTAAPHAFLAHCFRQLSAKTAGLISCLQPLYGVALAALILGQWPSSMVYIGGALIVAAAVLETILVTKNR
ncbi:DMT family transporter [Psychrobium sp. 1_MG-2023]|uniref:DMT family transporter n=1 Tax=Psychrobium sp. 1_MG-2023 TaxID=3062624 RepID=UPI000C329CF3|nr:DMT family transporter [Psychrobium sp. 1_MG-2023]MDP2562170.1 DMT family transporter [Psychrobium sp. 1_MG-2023]PKF57160.1 EamA family transporter [Alteromonadales bacterium alter-6D02]